MSISNEHLAGVDDGPEPDAIARGWVVPPGGTRVDAIFVLSGTSLGIGRIERVTPPVWLNLDELVRLDAIGEPVDGLTEVEIVMEDHRAIGAGWTDEFCDAVVEVLQASAGRPGVTPGSPADAHPVATGAPADAPPSLEVAPPVDSAAPGEVPPPVEAGPFAAAPVVPVPEQAPPAPTVPSPVAPALFAPPVADAGPTHAGGPAPAPVPAPPTPAGATVPSPTPANDAPAASLELEDVVYLGGYPGQSKRRKKCVVTMGRSGLELSGPGDLRFRVGWEGVRAIEVQNSDEARFRMNTKIHRDASALVVECDQGVTILMEARDCPTIALRSAIAQLLAGLPVLVV